VAQYEFALTFAAKQVDARDTVENFPFLRDVVAFATSPVPDLRMRGIADAYAAISCSRASGCIARFRLLYLVQPAFAQVFHQDFQLGFVERHRCWLFGATSLDRTCKSDREIRKRRGAPRLQTAIIYRLSVVFCGWLSDARPISRFCGRSPGAAPSRAVRAERCTTVCQAKM